MGKMKRSRSARILVSIGVLLVLHVVFLAYPFVRLGGWLGWSGPWAVALGCTIVFSQVICRWPLRSAKGRVLRAFKQGLEVFLAVSPIVLLCVLAGEGLLLVGLIDERAAGIGIVLVLCLSVPVGILHGSTPRTRSIDLSSPKVKSPLHLVQITDVHLGSRGAGFLRNILAEVMVLNPDALCITGDFIDATDFPESSLQPLADLPMPIYFVIGNHERYEDLDQIVDRLTRQGVIVLRNAAASLRPDVQIIGIDDADDPGQLARWLPVIEQVDDAYKVLLYHRPSGLDQAASAGLQLTLSGHNHNGQVWPFNLLVQRVFPMIKGLYHTDQCAHYVSEGTGTWGPVFRLGTRGEITSIWIRPAMENLS